MLAWLDARLQCRWLRFRAFMRRERIKSSAFHPTQKAHVHRFYDFPPTTSTTAWVRMAATTSARIADVLAAADIACLQEVTRGWPQNGYADQTAEIGRGSTATIASTARWRPMRARSMPTADHQPPPQLRQRARLALADRLVARRDAAQDAARRAASTCSAATSRPWSRRRRGRCGSIARTSAASARRSACRRSRRCSPRCRAPTRRLRPGTVRARRRSCSRSRPCRCPRRRSSPAISTSRERISNIPKSPRRPRAMPGTRPAIPRGVETLPGRGPHRSRVRHAGPRAPR